MYVTMKENELETAESPKHELLKASCGFLCAVFNAIPSKKRPFQLESIFNLISATYTLYKIIDKKLDKSFESIREKNKAKFSPTRQPI